MSSRAIAKRSSLQTADINPFETYIADLNANLRTNCSTEHTHRPALVDLFQSLVISSRVLNEPSREKYGAPDIVVFDGEVPIGYMECKDIGVSLDSPESIEQLEKYKKSLKNIIHTDYLEFRWYRDGDLVLSVNIGQINGLKVIAKNSEFERLALLFKEFYSTVTETITNSKNLAVRLAGLATMVRELIQATLSFDDPDSRWLQSWKSAFQETLFKTLDDKQFADMFAQTLAYGFFSARMQTDDMKYFSRLSAGHIVPRTNPFLRKLFIQFAGPDMPTCINWAADELVKTLKYTDKMAIEEEFSGNSGKSDPILHFYETFLKEYDHKLKVDKGVFYTPQPIVDFIVTGVDDLLKNKLKKLEGLSSDEAIILDPAVGTGSFLKSIIDKIYDSKKANQGAWESYVNDSLLPRMYGFEVLMAPYSVAHLKIGYHLQKTGYKFSGSNRLGIYLTNTLEETPDIKDSLFIEALAEESNEAAKVKNEEQVMIIVGNPPYKGRSNNKGKWILDLIKDYKKDLKEKKTNLDDDFIKFVRFSQWKIDKTGAGVLAMITNNVFLDAITHRRMRKSLMESFDDIYILNLHGSVQKRDICEDGSPDENVFDIPLGVSVTFMIKRKERAKKCTLHYSSLQGKRDLKYEQLSTLRIEDVKWKTLEPTEKYFFFVPRDNSNTKEYERFASLKDIFSLSSSGIQTKRDDLAIAFQEDTLKERLRDFASLDEDSLRTNYKLPADGRDWTVPRAQKHAKEIVKNWSKLAKVLYRPFDVRWTVMDDVSKGFVAYPRFETMTHLTDGKNLALITPRQLSLEKYQHAFVTRHLIDGNTISMQSREYNYVMPLFLQPGSVDLINEKRANFTPAFQKYLSSIEQIVGPEEIFYYIYAILNAPSYGERFNDNLKSDFARIPLTTSPKIIRKLARLGKILTNLHTLECSVTVKSTFPISGSNSVEKWQYDENNERIYINETQYFSNVSTSMKAFEVGGYNVVDRWFKSRKGMALNHKDIDHVALMLASIERCGRLTEIIDNAIDRMGGYQRLQNFELNLSLNTEPKKTKKKAS